MSRTLALLAAALVWALLPIAPANADVTLTQTLWDNLPRVQIAKGNAGDCEGNAIIYEGEIPRGYSRTFPGTGTNGVDICFRRTLDPDDPNSPLDPTWTRCSSDGECNIP